MNLPIRKLKGMSAELEAKLERYSILDSDQLLNASRTSAARHDLAKAMGVEASVILKLANRADLVRVKGIGRVFSDLLEQAGVDSVKELANRRPDQLHVKLVEVNAQKQLAGRAPTRNAVESWVAQAKQLPETLEY
jgi:predicted flap endonuclease-1-like 5' DNA nuclease